MKRKPQMDEGNLEFTPIEQLGVDMLAIFKYQCYCPRVSVVIIKSWFYAVSKD